LGAWAVFTLRAMERRGDNCRRGGGRSLGAIGCARLAPTVLRLVDMLIARVWGGQADPVRRHEMSEIEIVIAAAGGQRQADVFTAHWGDILLATSRTPFFDSARKLLEIGAEPSDLLIMRHQGSSTPSLRARIAVAAKLAVTDTRVGPRYVPWVDLRGIWAKTEDDAQED